jgi:hypothetical protein
MLPSDIETTIAEVAAELLRGGENRGGALSPPVLPAQAGAGRG